MEKENEFNFVTYFWIAWDQKYLVLALSLVGGAIATYLALTATPMFRAQVTVTEVHDTGIGGSGSLMGQLGGLASIAGLNMNGGGQDAERQAILESRGLVEAFVKRYDLTALMNNFSKESNSLWYAVERFRGVVIEIHEEKLKGTTVITVEWRDPVVAARWANDFVALANEQLRNRAIEESTRNVEYLNKQLNLTNEVEVQRAMNALIEAETKKLMMAHGRAEYAFTVVDPAVAAEHRFSPRRTLMVLSGLFVGGFVGSLIAWARKAARRRPSIATN
jgi:uncharacterized protein involved in exopolysaccharide biosynthesis